MSVIRRENARLGQQITVESQRGQYVARVVRKLIKPFGLQNRTRVPVLGVSL